MSSACLSTRLRRPRGRCIDMPAAFLHWTSPRSGPGPHARLPGSWDTIKPRSSPGGASSAPHLTGHFEVGGSVSETSEIDEPDDLA